MIIGVDLDDTVADLHTPWLGAYNKQWAKTHGKLTTAHLHSWQSIGETPIGSAMYEYLSAPHFFRSLEPFPGAVAELKRLASAGHRIVVTTACLKTQYAVQKAEWVKEHLPFVDAKDVFFGASKELLRFDVFIDDAPKNLRAYRKAWPYAGIAAMEFPYNKAINAVSYGPVTVVDCLAASYKTPARAWKQIGAFVDALAGEKR